VSNNKKRKYENENENEKPKIYVILLGPPSCGKGTQSHLLLEKFNFIQISGGDLLRREKKKNTNRGKLLNEKEWNYKQMMEITQELVEEELLKVCSEKKGFILDGIPKSFEGLNFIEFILK